MGKQNLPIYGIFIAATHEQFFMFLVGFCMKFKEVGFINV
jgi:hypothetical protein